MEQIEKRVLELYEEGCSIKEASKRCSISEYKVTKILCNAGACPSPRAKEIMGLWKQGKTQEEIADMLHVSRNAVQRYIPYTRGMQYSDNPSINALRIRKCRKK